MTITDQDWKLAAANLGCATTQIRAVWEVECGGGGFFNDVRADILAADGPGGLIDGSSLPKILFEAHIFAKYTNNRYNISHPNISSPVWKRALYVGGQAEYVRLANAAKLDQHAALLSASVGGPQIMGFNFAAAGYATVEDFWNGMKAGEKNQLLAFVSLLIHNHWVEKLRRIDATPANCAPFAEAYNGKGYAANKYHEKLAAAYKKWIK